MFKRLKSHLYSLQLIEYEPRPFLNWLSRNLFFFPEEKKGRLGWSGKAQYIFAASILIHLIVSLIPAFLLVELVKVKPANYYLGLLTFIAFFFLLDYLPSLPLLLALLTLKPYEVINRRRLIGQIQKIIQSHKDLKVVGITGSFGKTSVKENLRQLLSTKFKVVAPPGSHNKIFSIATTIAQQLKEDSEILIVEMGAYHKGEIAEICKMTSPQVGILTGITSQHLQRFETLENIKKTKYELIESLPTNGLAVFNLDNEETSALYQKCSLNKIGYSLKDTAMEISSENTFFNLFGQRVKTTLLGKQNVQNILAAAAVAKYLGLTEAEIIKTIPLIHPVPHRLELIRAQNQALIIDDAYSSNLEGYKAAFDLVGRLKNYPKILVTPGLVELGGSQEIENSRMAKAAATVFDYAIIVNWENRESLVSGFESSGWILYDSHQETDPGRWTVAYQGILKDKIVFTADTLNEATQNLFPKVTKPGSLMLLENDLPDIYR